MTRDHALLAAYQRAFPHCDKHAPTLDSGTRSGCVWCFWQQMRLLIEKLDEAMADPAVVKQHTEEVGGFISSLDLTETAEQIVERACRRLKGERR